MGICKRLFIKKENKSKLINDPLHEQEDKNNNLAEVISILFVAIVLLYLFLKILFF